MNLSSSRTKQKDEKAPAAPGKTQMGIPNPGSSRGVVLAEEARRSRHRLYPVTVVYSSFAAVVLFVGARSNAALALFLAALGLAFWTAVEYWVHRTILHGVVPVRGSAWSRFLNQAFDHLHWQHHLRPWDGNHINGTIFDTLWFRGLKARHFYHHSRLGADILFGLSNGFWDDVIGTAMPAPSSAPEPVGSIRARSGLWQIHFDSRPRWDRERAEGRPSGCSSSQRSREL